MISVFVDGIGVYGPGLPTWSEAAATLRAAECYRSAPVSRPTPTILSATERRRSTNITLLAVQVAQEAMSAGANNMTNVRMVFASSGGDLEISQELCAALALPTRAVSPTRFHNSVHNAPAGYWAIAAHATESATSLSCYDATFAAGLLEASAQAHAHRCAVLFVAYDWPPPSPLLAKRPLSAPFGVALLLAPQPSSTSLASLTLDFEGGEGAAITAIGHPELEQLRQGIPAARALPLLAAIVGGKHAVIAQEYLAGWNFSVIVDPVDAQCR